MTKQETNRYQAWCQQHGYDPDSRSAVAFWRHLNKPQLKRINKSVSQCQTCGMKYS